jgi:hypothetical protein
MSLTCKLGRAYSDPLEAIIERRPVYPERMGAVAGQA